MAEKSADGDPAQETDDLVELPSWVRRARPSAKPHPRPTTLSERLRQAAGDEVLDLVAVEEAVAQLRHTDESAHSTS